MAFLLTQVKCHKALHNHSSSPSSTANPILLFPAHTLLTQIHLCWFPWNCSKHAFSQTSQCLASSNYLSLLKFCFVRNASAVCPKKQLHHINLHFSYLFSIFEIILSTPDLLCIFLSHPSLLIQIYAPWKKDIFFPVISLVPRIMPCTYYTGC